MECCTFNNKKKKKKTYRQSVVQDPERLGSIVMGGVLLFCVRGSNNHAGMPSPNLFLFSRDDTLATRCGGGGGGGGNGAGVVPVRRRR